MSTDTKSLDTILRERGRKEIAEQIEKAVRSGLIYNKHQNADYTEIRLDQADIHVVDRGSDKPEEERYIISIQQRHLVNCLIEHALEYHGSIAEQREVNEFLDRVDSVAQDIEDLRNGTEER